MPKIISNAKQTKMYNCGAFGLAAICEAFGLLPSENDVFLYHRERSATIASNLSVPEAAEEIYKITGDLLPTGEHATEGEYTNSPSAISYVAKELGLTVTLNVPEKVLNEPNPFTNELLYCADVVTDVIDNRGMYCLSREMECQMVVVRTVSNGLHWLAVDSDGFIYDPATGTTHANWDTLNYDRLPFWLSFSLK